MSYQNKRKPNLAVLIVDTYGLVSIRTILLPRGAVELNIVRVTKNTGYAKEMLS
jgi:hypothetical protein